MELLLVTSLQHSVKQTQYLSNLFKSLADLNKLANALTDVSHNTNSNLLSWIQFKKGVAYDRNDQL